MAPRAEPQAPPKSLGIVDSIRAMDPMLAFKDPKSSPDAPAMYSTKDFNDLEDRAKAWFEDELSTAVPGDLQMDPSSGGSDRARRFWEFYKRLDEINDPDRRRRETDDFLRDLAREQFERDRERDEERREREFDEP
jgi:hypothetical protein